MSDDEIRGRADLMLGDLDALQPGRSFVPPPTLTTGEAYALQAEVVRLRERRGERVIGYKIGCISPVIQAQLGADRPIFGRVFDTGCFPPGSRVSHARFADLAIEGELAIRLARDVPGSTLSDDEAAAAIGSVFPVIELHHYGWLSVGLSLPALIATSGMHAGLVPSAEETSGSGRVPAVKELSIRINDEVLGSTTQPWAMGSATAGLRWLSSHLESVGERLMRDQVILTGSVLPLFLVRPGDRAIVEARPLARSLVDIDP
jgi:2-keto-4-pentenoate hydratase